MMSVSHGVELRSRLIRRSRSAIMSTSTSAFSDASEPVRFAVCHVVAAAVGVVVALPLDDRFLAVEKQQLDRQRIASRLQHARDLEQERRARSAVVGADEPELAKPLGVVVAGDDEPILARAGNRRDQVHHVDAAGGRLIVPRLLGDRRRRPPRAGP